MKDICTRFWMQDKDIEYQISRIEYPVVIFETEFSNNI